MCCSFVPYVSFNRWACGVILFTLLAGSPPFWHRKQLLMLRTIMEGRYQFSSPEWDDRSDTVKDLVRVSYARKCSEMYPIHVYMYLLKMFIFSQISRLLVVEPTLRLTAEQALAHPFFCQYQKEDVRLFSPRKTFKVTFFMYIHYCSKQS